MPSQAACANNWDIFALTEIAIWTYYILFQWSRTLLAPGTSVMVDNFSMEQVEAGEKGGGAQVVMPWPTVHRRGGREIGDPCSVLYLETKH